MKYLRTITGFFIIILTMILLVPAAVLMLPLHLAGFKERSAIIIHFLVKYWARLAIIVTGCDIKASGCEHIPKKGSLCFVSNHSGIFDILLLLSYASRPFGFIAKKELSYIPLLNLWILILGGLFIDRVNPRKALKTISNGVRHIKNGGAMLIFPEGTRSKGRGLLPFKQGALKLAVRSGAPIIPVAITGSYEVFEKNKLIIKSNVAISFGKLILPAEYAGIENRNTLAEKVHTVIDEMLRNQ